MKIDELMRHLRKIRKETGNVEVVAVRNGNAHEVVGATQGVLEFPDRNVVGIEFENLKSGR